MGFYLLFLVFCFVLGLTRPTMPMKRARWIIVGLALVLSLGVFVFRLA